MLSALMYSLGRWVRHHTPPLLVGALYRASIAIFCASVASASISCGDGAQRTASTPASTPASTSASASAARSYESNRQSSQQAVQQPAPAHTSRTGIGFRSRKLFNEHFAKHGDEFGHITQQQYLRLAQTLRDEPAGGNVLEIRRSDGTVSRYDRTSGAFIAFNANGTIRTFFKPNNGEAYFRRQATQAH